MAVAMLELTAPKPAPAGARWRPRRNPHSLVATVYAVAKVYNLEPAGTRRNPRRSPHSLMGMVYAFAKVLQLGARRNPLEPAAEPALFYRCSTHFSNLRSYPVIYLYY